MYNPYDDRVALQNPPPPLLPPVRESWRRQHDKIFETALVTFPEDSLNRWENIAKFFPGATPDNMRARYDALVCDVYEIEAGQVEMPRYTDDTDSCGWQSRHGQPWTEEEHKRFLVGLKECGKGDWRRISRSFVLTRSSTQIASHAQKFFRRQTESSAPNKKRRKKRSSIHDITIASLDHASGSNIPLY